MRAEDSPIVSDGQCAAAPTIPTVGRQAGSKPMGIKRISTDKSVVFSYGQCGRPLVHGTNLSDAGEKSASGK
jgi:hypothetical protein